MSRKPDRLSELITLHIRKSDAENGSALRALLAVIGEQVDLVQTDLERLYDNWFVETAESWAVPYLGDLVGYRLPAGHEEALATAATDRLVARLAPRRDVAATVGSRQRKGTLPTLEELASSVADWPSRAVEFHRLLLRYQPIGLYPSSDDAAVRRAQAAPGLVDVRHDAELEGIGGPFETQGHIAEAARIGSSRRPGRYRPANAGVYVWRLRPQPLNHAPAYCIDRARNQFTFSILGNDVPLATKPVPEPSPGHIARREHVPAPITRRELADRLPDFYGRGKSFAIWRDGQPDPVPLGDIVVADLSGWFYRAPRAKVVVDPELGRIVFGARSAPRRGVWVSYHFLQPSELGGGEYPRDVTTPGAAKVYRVGPGEEFERIQLAYVAWQRDNSGGAQPEAVIEIADSGAYQEQLEFVLSPGDRLEVRAADRKRPVLRLLDWYSNRPDSLQIRALGAQEGDDRPPPRFVLDGLLITGRGVSVTGPMGGVVVRHSTLVPGWSLEPRCRPTHPEEPSLVLEDTTACVEISNSVVGSILVMNDEAGTDPIEVCVTDSVLDATGADREAVSAPECRHAHAVLTVRRSTVIGEVHTHAIRLGENSVFDGLVHVARRGLGCLRFCYVPPGSRTPRRYHCQPDLVAEGLRRLAESGDVDSADLPRLRSLEAMRVRPRFTSRRYGAPAYLQLASSCAVEISRGADDGSELGVLHDLFQPQREDNLWARLAEFSPAGMDAGIALVN
ncbi:hypothetical protein [Streptomyces albipurpureus]|uniref:Uncharacterized protein n=1 Tax=Streptomyces albipurpureus TaxID=2897419 RepID=A0ABT0UFT7_9ACTN|nr:hypothetical protein [Streptomyces sp. CWNU-1]MCM2387484.1 hypothetical protein [Streptomyces sp. CWNU-1]